MDSAATVMPIDIGAAVIGSDEETLGKVACVVVEPTERRFTDLVVHTGIILGRDVVVPVECIRTVAEDGAVLLWVDKHALQAFPRYIESSDTPQPADWVPPESLDDPPGGVLWVGGAGVRVNTPPGTLGIRDGTDVCSSDGHKVGGVDALDVDLTTGEVRGVVVKRGILVLHDTCIPVGDVRDIRPGRVVLYLTREQVKAVEQEQWLSDD